MANSVNLDIFPHVFHLLVAYYNLDVSDRYACSLLRQGMKPIVITLDSPDINALEKQGDKEAIAKVLDWYQFDNNQLSVLVLNS